MAKISKEKYERMISELAEIRRLKKIDFDLIRNKLNPVWESKKDFRDFLIKAHEKLGCFP